MSTRTPSSRRALPLLALLLVFTAAPLTRAADDDPMAPYRGRFQSGMERYKAGDAAGAVHWWEPIFTDVGIDKGYRVAFDLGRAYDKLGNAKLAAARYRAFLGAVDARRARGETIEPVVATEETEARARVAQIGDVGDPAPTPSPAATSPAPPAPAPEAATATPPAAPPPLPPGPASPPPTAPEHPFSPWVLVAGGALTVGAGVVCAVEYARALSTKSDFNAAASEPSAAQGAIRDTYDGIRPVAYGALGATVGFAAVTGALATWYFAGAKEGSAPRLSAAPAAHGAQIGVSARF